jgi:hypothetical protein
MPLSSFDSEAAFMTAFTSSTVVSRAATNERSHQRDVDRRHADRVAVELPVELGEHQAHRGGGAPSSSGSWTWSRARAPQVLVVHVGQHLSFV